MLFKSALRLPDELPELLEGSAVLVAEQRVYVLLGDETLVVSRDCCELLLSRCNMCIPFVCSIGIKPFTVPR